MSQINSLENTDNTETLPLNVINPFERQVYRFTGNDYRTDIFQTTQLIWIFPDHPLELHKSQLRDHTISIFLSNLLVQEITTIIISNKQPFLHLPEYIIKQIIQAFLNLVYDLDTKTTVISLSCFLFDNALSLVNILDKVLPIEDTVVPVIKQKEVYTRNINTRALCVFQPTIIKKNIQTSITSVKRALKRRQIKLVRYAKLFINLTRTNIFITISNKRRQVKYAVSAGMANFKGRHKSSGFARDSVARLASYNAIKLHIRLIDVWFGTTLSKLYRPIITGLISHLIIIRVLRIRYYRSHGDMRYRKARRI